MPDPDVRLPVARREERAADEVLERAEAIVSRRPEASTPATLDLTGRPEVGAGRARPTPDGPLAPGPAPPAAVSPARSMLSAVLIPLGILLVTFTAFHRWGGSFTEARAQRALRSKLDVALTRAQAVAAVGDTTEVIPPGKPVALLRIPALGIEKVVVQGTTSRMLQRGPGHHRASAGVGHEGNAVVVGRRSTYGRPFEKIAALPRDADIEMLTSEGRFIYKVSGKKRVAAGDDTVLAQPTGTSVLTLLTGGPGSGSDWYTVTASLQGDPLPETSPVVGAINEAELSLSGDSAALLPLLFWGQVLALVLVARRRMAVRWKRGSVWVLTTPVVVAAAVLVFEAGDGLLPPVL